MIDTAELSEVSTDVLMYSSTSKKIQKFVLCSTLADQVLNLGETTVPFPSPPPLPFFFSLSPPPLPLLELELKLELSLSIYNGRLRNISITPYDLWEVPVFLRL